MATPAPKEATKKLSDYKLNDGNPRTIKDVRFEALKRSIKEFPKMLDLRPIIYDKTRKIIAGNMRFRALLALGYEEVAASWLRSAADLTEEERRRFIVIDNEGFGENDWDILANQWDSKELVDWGVEIPHVSTSQQVSFSAAEKKGLKLKVEFQTQEQATKAVNFLKKMGIDTFKLT